MRLNTRFFDRIGIFQEMLSVFAARRPNVTAAICGHRTGASQKDGGKTLRLGIWRMLESAAAFCPAADPITDTP
ncbi:MAG: hypothetical protein JNM60_00255 [Candidatus Competibacteraceae bacterium]|nr:hypothetical protein [Candidatus Competibacteraceae bacterium]